MNYLNNFEEACARRGVKPEDVIAGISVASRFMKNAMSYVKLLFMVETANLETHKRELPNYTDNNEYKYESWAQIEADEERPSGFGFSGTSARTLSSITCAGVRLQFLDDDYAMHAIANWQEYKEFMLANIEAETSTK